MNGAELIAKERQRQISGEGWSPAHDAIHTEGQMAAAAMCYTEQVVDDEIRAVGGSGEFVQQWWPWDEEWWKPSLDPIRNLVKAGALIAAEIDRLQTNR